MDKFTLSRWASPGTHTFTYTARDGKRLAIIMNYSVGRCACACAVSTGRLDELTTLLGSEPKKEGWGQNLVVMEYISLAVVDPLQYKMPYLVEMLEIAQEEFAEKDSDTVRFQHWNGWKQMWEANGADERIPPNAEELVFYPKELLERVYFECERFLSTPADVILRAGLPLKLGILLHGPPGTGKTHLVRHLAAHFGLDLNIIDCNNGEFGNTQLMDSINAAQGIVLIEDIDNIDAAVGLKPSSADGKQQKVVTLDGLLNSLDGVQRGTQKRIIIATTNYVEKLVPSLRRRGRLGLAFKIGYPNDEQLNQLFNHFVPSLNPKKLVDALRSLEERYGLCLATSAATDVAAKAHVAMQSAVTVTVDDLLSEFEEVLGALEETNRKSFTTATELLDFLHLSDEVIEKKPEGMLRE